MEIPDTSTCLSPSSVLASDFSRSIAVSSPPDHLPDDRFSRLSRHVFIPTQSNIPTTNLILSLPSTPNIFEYYHPQQRRDQQTIVTSSNSSTSTSNATPPSTHVLCR